MGSETYEVMQARLTKAFDLVCDHGDWKRPIDALVFDMDLDAVGLTVEDVREAVIHFTATVPVVRHPSFACWRFTAIGYRAGPAGDH